MMSVEKALVITGLFVLFVQNHFVLTIYLTIIKGICTRISPACTTSR